MKKMTKNRRYEADDEEDFEPRGKRSEVDLDDVLDGMEEAEVSGRLPKLRDGDYTRLKVDAFTLVDGHFGQGFAIEFTLEGSHSKDEHQAGQRLSTTIMGLDKRNRRKMAQGNVKGFLAAAFGLANDDETLTALCKKCLQDNSKIAGKYVNATCEKTETKGGFDFLRVTYAPATASKKSAASRRDEPEDDEEEDETPPPSARRRRS